MITANRQAIIDTLNIGDEVRILHGRYAGSRGVIMSLGSKKGPAIFVQLEYVVCDVIEADEMGYPTHNVAEYFRLADVEVIRRVRG